jgi:hypothetical protein
MYKDLAWLVVLKRTLKTNLWFPTVLEVIWHCEQDYKLRKQLPHVFIICNQMPLL